MIVKIDILELLSKNIDENRIFTNEPMKKHTSFKVGGNADFYVLAKNIEEIKWVLEISKKYDIQLTVVGNGTNLLVLDSGIRGIVLRPNLNQIEVRENLLKVGAGAMLSVVSRKALEHELTGLEFAYGIPGTIGGAVRMNAGAYGGEMKDVVKETTYITRNGEEHTNTVLKLEKGEKTEIEAKMHENMESRKKNQPLEFANAGSTFKRGEGFITAKLIDEAGLKGYRIGDAEISTKHGGFIINRGNATAKDILKLVEYAKKQIYEKFGKSIELEIIVIGEK